MPRSKRLKQSKRSKRSKQYLSTIEKTMSPADQRVVKKRIQTYARQLNSATTQRQRSTIWQRVKKFFIRVTRSHPVLMTDLYILLAFALVFAGIYGFDRYIKYEHSKVDWERARNDFPYFLEHVAGRWWYIPFRAKLQRRLGCGLTI